MDIGPQSTLRYPEGRIQNLAKEFMDPKTESQIVVMEDTNKDGKADKSWTFIEDEELVAPLGVADSNKVVVMAPRNYTDVNENADSKKVSIKNSTHWLGR